MSDSAIAQDAMLAAELAEAAGQILLSLQREGKLSGRQLGVAGDQAANDFLLQNLRRLRPDDALLSEEEVDNPERLTARRVWIIDPLDGTREFGELRSDWAVHVALSIDGFPAAGAVALPGLGTLHASCAPVPLLPANSPLKMVVSRSRPPSEATGIGHALAAELVPMGSAGAKAMAVVRGEADVYLHSGGQYAWDNCAPVAVALAHGLHCSRLDGAPLLYNCRDTLVPDLLICRPELARPILDLIASQAG